MNKENIFRSHGFEIKRTRRVEELNGTLYEMEHKKSGAQLCWLDNKLDNKLFSITFRTFPEDSTGVFHILEHSVLGGSKKYPVREPFVELIKSSMNTFLNAMTYPDKTVYPISSRNDKDFLNLTEVYLDAVFAPSILTFPNIFYQEGWHTEFEDGKPQYKGVVFNEMKGVFSGVEGLVEETIPQMLFPDTCYGFCSGGDPEHIPELTYEKFIETYKRFYHPSNSRIFLDGDIPLEGTFKLLEEYLDGFEKLTDLPKISFQKPCSSSKTIYYELGQDEDEKDKSFLAVAKIFGTWKDRTKAILANVIFDTIAGSNESPLKRRILDSGLCEEMSVIVQDYMAQYHVEIDFRNVKDGRENDLLELLKKTVSDLISEKIDREALKATINQYEFKIKEQEEPQGLIRAINADVAWIHDGDPLETMLFNDEFKKIRNIIETDQVEELLKELIVNDENDAVLLAKPSKTIGEEKRLAEQQRLEKTVSTWTEKDKEENAAMVEQLVKWQQTPDTPEQLATIPTLDLKDVSPDPIVIPTTEDEIDGVKVVYHKVPANGIVYVNAYYSIPAMKDKKSFQILGTFVELLGFMPTKKHTALELEQLIRKNIGKLEFSLVCVNKESSYCECYISAKFSALEENLKIAGEIVAEILNESVFDNDDVIKEIIIQNNEKAKQFPVYEGHALGTVCILSHYSSGGALDEALRGLSGLHFIHDLANNFDSLIDDFRQRAKDMFKDCFCKKRMIVSVSGTKETSPESFISLFEEGTPAGDIKQVFKTDLPKIMGIKSPSQISFAEQGYHLDLTDNKYHGSMAIATNIISMGYLWIQVRVQGGAYGTGIRIRRTGQISSYSYRDPSPDKSITANKGISQFLQSFCQSGEEIDRFIISTIASLEPLIGAKEMALLADNDWLTGYTDEEKYEGRKEILSSTKEDLLKLLPLFDKFANEGAICVVGPESVLKNIPGIEMFNP